MHSQHLARPHTYLWGPARLRASRTSAPASSTAGRHPQRRARGSEPGYRPPAPLSLGRVAPARHAAAAARYAVPLGLRLRAAPLAACSASQTPSPLLCTALPFARSAGAAAAGAAGPARGQRHALDDTYILSLVWQQQRALLTALGALLLCVASNLTSPVLSGMLFELLVQGQPLAKWVGGHGAGRLHAARGMRAYSCRAGGQEGGPVERSTAVQGWGPCCKSQQVLAQLSTRCACRLHYASLALRRYGRLLALMAALYVAEPLLSQVYVQKACEAGEKVQAALRLEAFRTLLMQRIE